MKNAVFIFLFLFTVSAKAQSFKLYELQTPVQGFDTTFTHLKYKVSISVDVSVFWFLPADTSLDLYDVGGTVTIPADTVTLWQEEIPNWATDGETIPAYLERKKVWRKN